MGFGTVPKSDRETIQAGLLMIPDILKAYSLNTEDQETHRQSAIWLFHNVGEEIISLFSGKKIIYDNSHLDLSKDQKNKVGNITEVLGLLSDRYIDLYLLIYSEWEEIIKITKKHDRPFFAEPGELLVTIVALECKSFFEMCFQEVVEIKPRKAYEYYINMYKAEHLEVKIANSIKYLFGYSIFLESSLQKPLLLALINDSYTEKDWKLVYNHKLYSQKIKQEYKAFYGELYSLLSFVFTVAKQSKNKTVKMRLNNWLKTCNTLMSFLGNKFYRYSKNQTWIRGEVMR